MHSEDPRSAHEVIRILAIDDEPSVLKLVKTILIRAKYDITTCTSGLEALKLLLTTETHFDCIITDALMPEMNGYELVKAIRTKPFYSRTPILMLTRKRNRKDIKLAADSGATDYILKPIDEQLFLEKIEFSLSQLQTKRQSKERALQSHQTRARLALHCRISAISETHVSLITPFPVSAKTEFDIQGVVFDEIGIKAPAIKLVSCKPIGEGAETYESKFTFVAVSESDATRIRSWIHQEAARQRK